MESDISVDLDPSCDGGQPCPVTCNDAAACKLPSMAAYLPLDEGAGQSVAVPGKARFLRGIWDHLQDIPETETEGVAEIKQRVARLKAAGFNAVFLWTVSRYVDAIRDPAKYGSTFPLASWDAIRKYMELARAEGFEVYLWYSVSAYKETFRATELEAHPEWAVADLVGGTGYPQVDIAHDEARAFEVEIVRFLTERYRPDGIQLEEPYYAVPTPTSSGFVGKFQAKFGYHPSEARSTRDSDVITIKRDVFLALMETLRETMFATDPSVVLQVNGAVDPTVTTWGIDVLTWSQKRFFDVYVPQCYYSELGLYQAAVIKNRDLLQPRLSLLIGTGIGWTEQTSNPAYASQWHYVESLQASDAPSGTISFAFTHFPSVEASFVGKTQPVFAGFLGKSENADPSDPSWESTPSHGKALKFDGVNDFVTLPASHALDEFGHFTFAAHLKIDANHTASWATLYQRGTQTATTGFVWIYYEPTGKIKFQLADGVDYLALTSTPMTLSDGKWHHLAIVQDRKTQSVTFYLDGKKHSSTTYKLPSLPVTQGTAWIGTYGGTIDANYHFKGELAEVALFRTALSEAQIASLAK